MSVEDIVAKNSASIMPMLDGLSPEIQAGVLADLVATWLAAFQGPDAEKLREQLLEFHVAFIRELVPLNEKVMLDRMANGTRQ